MASTAEEEGLSFSQQIQKHRERNALNDGTLAKPKINVDFRKEMNGKMGGIFANFIKKTWKEDDETYFFYWNRMGLPSEGMKIMEKSLKKHVQQRVLLMHLPVENCVFFLSRRTTEITLELMGPSLKNDPCIFYTLVNPQLKEKTWTNSMLHKYYGEKAWDFVPVSFQCIYNHETKEWDLPESENFEEFFHKHQDYAWITKFNTGARGFQINVYGPENTFENIIEDVPKLNGHIIEHYLETISNEEPIEEKNWAVQISQYIKNPLLISGGRKFDLRIYLLLAHTNPCICFYYEGKCRMSGVEYSPDDFNDVFAHLTNCAVQKKHENYDEEEMSVEGKKMVANWEQAVDLILEAGREKFPIEWFLGHNPNNITHEEMKVVLDTHLKEEVGKLCDAFVEKFDKSAVEHNMSNQFSLYGVDYLVDENGKFWFIEINTKASLQLFGDEVIKASLAPMMDEIVDIAWELRQKYREGNLTVNTELESVKYWQRVQLHHYDNVKGEN